MITSVSASALIAGASGFSNNFSNKIEGDEMAKTKTMIVDIIKSTKIDGKKVDSESGPQEVNISLGKLLIRNGFAKEHTGDAKTKGKKAADKNE